MHIYVVNESTILKDSEVQACLPAFQEQTWQLRAWWNTAAASLFFGKPSAEAWQIVIVDDADQAGALGYHDFTPGGRPISYVFAKTSRDYGYNWTGVLSHELVEMIADPYIQRCEQTGDRQFHALETADPVEAEQFGYTITKGGATVFVSDFVLPAWFNPAATKGPFDYKRHCTAPLQVLDGGYAYIWDGGWYAVDKLGNRTSAADFEKDGKGASTRLAKYARPRA